MSISLEQTKQLDQKYVEKIIDQNKTEGVLYPSYNRVNTNIGIVHLGLGAFHRSHQAMYTEQLLNLEGGNWGICGVSFRNETLQQQLNKQDGLYTMAILDVEDSFQVVGAIKEVLVVKTQAQKVLARMASPDTKLVSLTVTEKGYCLDSSGKLDEALPGITQDLLSPDSPSTAIGLIVASLNMRFINGIKPFNVIACDNLPDNGKELKSAVVQFANHVSNDLANWIDNNVKFPNTMVDSITPRTEEATVELVNNKLGIADTAPVQREQFAQWVIEDCGNIERPAWEKVGVVFTNNVESFEDAKLRILNGLHSALAYIGQLNGYETVYEAISDEKIKAFLIELVDSEIIPTIEAPTGLNLHDYSRAIIARFENPKIKHLLSQIACDGSIKIPVRTLAPLQNNLAAKRSIKLLSIVVAAWIHFIRNSAVNELTINDPRSDDLYAVASKFEGNNVRDVRRFITIDGLLAEHLAHDEMFVESVQQAYNDIQALFNFSSL